MIDSGFGVCYPGFMKAKLYFFTLFSIGAMLTVTMYGCDGEGIATYIPCEMDVDCWRKKDVDNGYRCFDTGCHGPCETVDDCWGGDVCHENHCTPPKYVPDAGGDASTDATSARCSDTCTPYPEGWSGIQAVWHGPASEAPKPADVPAEFGGPNTWPIFTGYADISAAPATCDVCKCGESTGKCTDLPETMSIRAASCGDVGASIEFGGPANWDGSCTDTYAMPALWMTMSSRPYLA